MQALLTDQVRLPILVGLCGLLWSVESIIPLYRYQNSRVRHALPNVALTLILVLTNLALSFSSAYLAGFAVRNGVGLFSVFGLAAWTQAVSAVVAFEGKANAARTFEDAFHELHTSLIVEEVPCEISCIY